MEINSVHFYVADAINTCSWFINCFDFQVVDFYPDTNTLTIAIKYQSILFVVSSPITNNSIVAYYLASRAEGISNIAFRVSRLESIINNAQKNGIKISRSLKKQSQIKHARVAGWECLQHNLIEARSGVNCYLLPNGKLRTFIPTKNIPVARFTFTAIDHIVLNVSRGQLARSVAYYQALFQLQIQQTFTIKTERSGLCSQALIDPANQLQFNINEPTNKDSQIQEFIKLNGGAGIQHLAFRSANLIQDVARMGMALPKSSQVSFLPIPQTYYTKLKESLERDLISLSASELESIISQEILIDWQNKPANSLLMQIFTQPIFTKPTFFLEFIERRQQAKGFGEVNFQALFAAVEREQMLKYRVSN